MSESTAKDQVRAYVSDAHSIEVQALAQLRSAPDLAGVESLAQALSHHLVETEGHERLVRERLDQLGETPSRMKDMLMAAGGKGFLLFARSQLYADRAVRPGFLVAEGVDVTSIAT